MQKCCKCFIQHYKFMYILYNHTGTCKHSFFLFSDMQLKVIFMFMKERTIATAKPRPIHASFKRFNIYNVLSMTDF